MSERLLTAREVASMLRLSTETVLRWHRSGKLPGGRRLATNVLRFDALEIRVWLDGSSVKGSGRRGEVSPAPSPLPTRGVVSQLSPAPQGGDHAS